jgi:hypothetical protein
MGLATGLAMTRSAETTRLESRSIPGARPNAPMPCPRAASQVSWARSAPSRSAQRVPRRDTESSIFLVSTFGGAFATADRAGEPPIVPPGWTFTIWSVIIALSIGYAIWADSDRRPDAELRARLTLPLLVTCVGFSVWLAAAELEPNWTTLVIFMIMLAALLRALMCAKDQRRQLRRQLRRCQDCCAGRKGRPRRFPLVGVAEDAGFEPARA